MNKLLVFISAIWLIAACTASQKVDQPDTIPSRISTKPTDQPSLTPPVPTKAATNSRTQEVTPTIVADAIGPGDTLESRSKAQPSSAPELNKWALWGDGPLLRGANVWQRKVYPELDGPEFMGPGPLGPPYTQTDFNRLAELGANYVNISHPGLFTETPPFTLDREIQDNLDTLLAMSEKADMFAVISFRTGPGRSEFTFVRDEVGDWFDESYLNDSVWEDQAAQEAWSAMWRYTAERYQDNPIVVGFDLMVEPNADEVWLDIYEPEEFYPDYAGTLYDWNQFYPRLVQSIRNVDPDTPILVGGMGYSAIRWLPYLEPMEKSGLVYTVHQYAPIQYTHQWYDSLEITYPGEYDVDWDGSPDQFDQSWLVNRHSTIDEFLDTHDAPVAVNEFGPVRWVPNADLFMVDQMELLEQRGLNHALWLWSPAWKAHAENDAFNFRHGPDPNNHTDVVSSKLMQVIIDNWGRNTIRPSNAFRAASAMTPGQPSNSLPDLADVSHWLYLIDVNLGPDTVEQIATSEYDLVVLDFIPSEVNNVDYPMTEVVSQLHNASRPKLVIAYIDIGQAEAYRTYWQPNWDIGNPEWIVGTDPDGWEGNYPVGYWYDEWREIWLAPDGYLQAILEAGFDGIYLDWVEAYSDENVVALAQKEGVDPLQEMIWWVGDMTDFTQNQKPNFIVISQNAAELAENDEYLEIIDAIAQEQIWFDGGADNDPPGDCPLPRTEAEIDSAAYRDSLSPECRDVYETYSDSTLHVSSEEYLHYLTLALDQGELIFTVDYALEPDNVAWVYQTSRSLGFVPFVGNRALDRFIEPYPRP